MPLDRSAVVIPGGKYGPHTPLHMYSADAAAARGARVRHISWDPPPTLFRGYDILAEETAPWVRSQVAPVLDETGGTPLLIAKSLGTFAAELAAERSLPAVWLTPLLRLAPVAAALRRATAPFLLVGGTADAHHWDGALARELTPHVLEVAGADHGMRVPGPLAASATVLGVVATAVEQFLDDVVWPG